MSTYGGILDFKDLECNFRENSVPVELLEDKISNYEEFLDARRVLMAEKVREYYFSL